MKRKNKEKKEEKQREQIKRQLLEWPSGMCEISEKFWSKKKREDIGRKNNENN